MKSITFKLDAFEGPFDLLFHLIEKNKIDIYDIPISELTDQYILYINSFENKDMDSISEFILMASTLVEIKSKMLLPKDKDEKEKEEDPRDELVNRLIEYKKFKAAAELLDKRQFYSEYLYFKKYDKTITQYVKSYEETEIKDIIEAIDLNLLYEAFKDVLKRKDIKVDKIRSNFNSVIREVYTIENKMQYINDLLIISDKIKFSEIFRNESTKSEIVTTFLAVLELIKIKKIRVFQKTIFDEIVISKY